jgi:hypothetical protein
MGIAFYEHWWIPIVWMEDGASLRKTYLSRHSQCFIVVPLLWYGEQKISKCISLFTNERNTLHFYYLFITPTYVSVLYKAIFKGFINYVHFTSNVPSVIITSPISLYISYNHLQSLYLKYI